LRISSQAFAPGAASAALGLHPSPRRS
jgi:hypothetical protein